MPCANDQVLYDDPGGTYGTTKTPAVDVQVLWKPYFPVDSDSRPELPHNCEFRTRSRQQFGGTSEAFETSESCETFPT